MNKLEEAWSKRLDLLRAGGEIVRWRFEPVKFRLGLATFYSPDFSVTLPGWVEFHEVKGFWEEDARVKWKAVAEAWPEFRWVAIKGKQRGRGPLRGYVWEVEVYGEKNALDG